MRLVLDSFNPSTGAPVYRSVSLTFDFSVTPPQTITMTDDFNDNMRDPSKWTVGTIHEQTALFDPPISDPETMVEEKNQHLEITPLSNFVRSRVYNGYVSSALWNLTGGSARVEVLQTAISGADTVFAIAIDSNNWYRFIVEDGFLYFQRKKDGVRVFEGNVRFDPVQHRFWRFRHDYALDRMMLETSPNGLNWNIMRAMPINIPLVAMRVELSAGTFTPVSNPGKAVFDNFKLEAINNAAPTSATVGFSSAQYFAPEFPGGVAVLRVDRIGDTTTAFTVDYSTSDTNSTTLTPCQSQFPNFWASERCDYITTAGTLRFAPGETFKFIRIPIVDDGYVESDERFLISLRNPQGAILNYTNAAVIVIPNSDTQPATQNPIDRAEFFVIQHYLDFLGRTPEPEGFQFWLSRMTNCPAGSTACDRIDTSLRFFQSDEFQATGFFVYRLYDAVLGRRPTYREFMADVGKLNGFQSPQEQRQSKDAYLLEFINKEEFRNLYGQYLTANGAQATNAAGFVFALIS
ncbi:MAG: hypothetical protein LC731_02185, partial [Acidobacteria bacterium]|nr:hypothetical protein [Acidobacteriota bacterium]